MNISPKSGPAMTPFDATLCLGLRGPAAHVAPMGN